MSAGIYSLYNDLEIIGLYLYSVGAFGAFESQTANKITSLIGVVMWILFGFFARKSFMKLEERVEYLEFLIQDKDEDYMDA